MRYPVLLACFAPILMACQTSAPPSFSDPMKMEQCAAESGFTARAAAARAAGATGRISSTPEELAAINACAGGGRSTQLQPVAGVPQAVEREVTATGTRETYTYGTPPSSKATPVPERSAGTRPRYCNPLTGGAGYGCAKQ